MKTKAFIDGEVQRGLQKLLWHNNVVGFIYHPAFVVPDIRVENRPLKQSEREENCKREDERKALTRRIRSIYASIAGFENKPTLKVSWSMNGNCLIELQR